VLSLVGLVGVLAVHPSRQTALAAVRQPANLEPYALLHGGHTSDSQPAVGNAQGAAISAEAVRIYKQRIGRGPTKTRTYWAGADTIVIVLEQTLTVAERKMLALDEHQRLRDLRAVLQTDGRSDFCDSIERITGRKVRALISGIDPVADVATEIFALDPRVTTAGRRPLPSS
jgi:uncharacterized protein YbcI